MKRCESRRKVVACAVRVQTPWCGDHVYFVHHLIPWHILLPKTQEVVSRYLSLFMNECVKREEVLCPENTMTLETQICGEQGFFRRHLQHRR